MAWTNGNSRTSTPAWRAIRKQVIARDGNRCVDCGVHGDDVRLECDHIVPVAEGGTDTLENARMLCTTCHAVKTRAESNRGRARRAARGHRPPEKHPGLL
ncbi:HNH endonuclease [Gordonia sp. MP11Mi]|uniref:HNH nuclease domain-containing protein n=1 Tax=Gordonia sp. MP11Mi TaxID=3022769 RepID=A0AA97GWD4_9ACTN